MARLSRRRERSNLEDKYFRDYFAVALPSKLDIPLMHTYRCNTFTGHRGIKALPLLLEDHPISPVEQVTVCLFAVPMLDEMLEMMYAACGPRYIIR